MGDDAEIFSDYFGIITKGNWEPDKNIPDINMGIKTLKKNITFHPAQLLEKIEAIKNKLFIERAKRISPHTDDKILASWNALMAKGFIDAYSVFGENDFLTMAQTNINFLLKIYQRKTMDYTGIIKTAKQPYLHF